MFLRIGVLYVVEPRIHQISEGTCFLITKFDNSNVTYIISSHGKSYVRTISESKLYEHLNRKRTSTYEIRKDAGT